VITWEQDGAERESKTREYDSENTVDSEQAARIEWLRSHLAWGNAWLFAISIGDANKFPACLCRVQFRVAKFEYPRRRRSTLDINNSR